VSHPARPPHQIWLPPLEVSEPIDSLVARLAGQGPWHVDYGQNPGLVFPVGIVDIPEEHTQRVHVIDAEMDNVMVVRDRPARQVHHVDDADGLGGR